MAEPVNVTDVASVAVAVVVVCGALFGLLAWFYKRGGQEQAYTDALNRNTKSNDDLSTKMDDFKMVVVDMFHQMDKRVTRLEDRAGVNVDA